MFMHHFISWRKHFFIKLFEGHCLQGTAAFKAPVFPLIQFPLRTSPQKTRGFTSSLFKALWRAEDKVYAGVGGLQQGV